MAGQRNYQKELDKLIDNIKKEEKVPRLFLHSCCAPCSSYVLEYLSQYFEITVFFYNPNITDEEEYRTRIAAQAQYLQCYNRDCGADDTVQWKEGPYEPACFFEAVKGLESEPEGGGFRTVIHFADLVAQQMIDHADHDQLMVVIANVGAERVAAGKQATGQCLGKDCRR